MTRDRTIEKASDRGSIGSIELPHNLLAIRPWVSSHPVTLVKVEQPICHWPYTHHLFSSPTTRVGSSFCGMGMDFELVASSDEAA
ncbi:hypothetical protein H5410_045576 [Solanum commersonii]|uniref:Uncharacterized protein n=1 Tax=Solanum commersonii TaxID=4109 RepID=A0A9J5XD47_SOLCO|nr:hypothetical protein H5410_045576 [Solanum commersonii]